VRPDGPILCPDRSSSRIMSSGVSGWLVDRLGSRFTSRHVSGLANLVSGRAWQKVVFLASVRTAH
jgi:hypothetical protein